MLLNEINSFLKKEFLLNLRIPLKQKSKWLHRLGELRFMDPVNFTFIVADPQVKRRIELFKVLNSKQILFKNMISKILKQTEEVKSGLEVYKFGFDLKIEGGNIIVGTIPK